MAAKKKLVWHRGKLAASFMENGKRKRISLGTKIVAEGWALLKKVNVTPRPFYHKGRFIYIAQMDTPDRFIKIGFATNVDMRVAKLNSSSPYKVTLLAATHGDRAEESVLLKRFRAHRVRGEWFRPHPDILAYVEEVNTPDPEWSTVPVALTPTSAPLPASMAWA